MSELLEGHRWNVDGWDGMVKWLEVSCGALDVADVLSIGPAGHIVYENLEGTEIVPNAQFQKLHGEVVLLRLSTAFMHPPLLADYSSDGLVLDSWREGDLFDDCTDGFIVGAGCRMLAEACVSWFRDRQGLELEELGCHHDRARSLRA